MFSFKKFYSFRLYIEVCVPLWVNFCVRCKVWKAVPFFGMRLFSCARIIIGKFILSVIKVPLHFCWKSIDHLYVGLFWRASQCSLYNQSFPKFSAPRRDPQAGPLSLCTALLTMASTDYSSTSSKLFELHPGRTWPKSDAQRLKGRRPHHIFQEAYNAEVHAPLWTVALMPEKLWTPGQAGGPRAPPCPPTTHPTTPPPSLTSSQFQSSWRTFKTKRLIRRSHLPSKSTEVNLSSSPSWLPLRSRVGRAEQRVFRRISRLFSQQLGMSRSRGQLSTWQSTWTQ